MDFLECRYNEIMNKKIDEIAVVDSDLLGKIRGYCDLVDNYEEIETGQLPFFNQLKFTIKHPFVAGSQSLKDDFSKAHNEIIRYLEDYDIKYTRDVGSKEKRLGYNQSYNEVVFKENGELFLGDQPVSIFKKGTNYYKILSLLFFDQEFINRQKNGEYISKKEMDYKIEGGVNIAKYVADINRRLKKLGHCLIEKQNTPKVKGNTYRLNLFLNKK